MRNVKYTRIWIMTTGEAYVQHSGLLSPWAHRLHVHASHCCANALDSVEIEKIHFAHSRTMASLHGIVSVKVRFLLSILGWVSIQLNI
jgi:hypothetical protein